METPALRCPKCGTIYLENPSKCDWDGSGLIETVCKIDTKMDDESIDSFMRTIRGRVARKGKLIPWESEIRELHKRGCAAIKIAEYLKQQGMNVTPATVLRFMQKTGISKPRKRMKK